MFSIILRYLPSWFFCRKADALLFLANRNDSLGMVIGLAVGGVGETCVFAVKGKNSVRIYVNMDRNWCGYVSKRIVVLTSCRY